jgi:hypothetical protein
MHGSETSTHVIFVAKPEGKRPLGRHKYKLEDVLKWILERDDGLVWTGLIWLRIGTSGRLLEHSLTQLLQSLMQLFVHSLTLVHF